MNKKSKLYEKAKRESAQRGLEIQRPVMEASLFAEIFDDLPDGAFFAIAGEMGLEMEDFIEDDEE